MKINENIPQEISDILPKVDVDELEIKKKRQYSLTSRRRFKSF